MAREILRTSTSVMTTRDNWQRISFKEPQFTELCSVGRVLIPNVEPAYERMWVRSRREVVHFLITRTKADGITKPLNERSTYPQGDITGATIGL